MTVDSALALRNAAFGYGITTRVDGLDFEVPRGAAVALIGPNGSGKSTLLRGVLGLADITEGSIEVLGRTPDAARQFVGTLPQSDARDTSLPVTVRQVVTMGLYRKLGPLGRLGKRGRAAVDGVIAQVGLAGFAERLFGELSGGQQQRAILARALVAEPELLLLDEPVAGMNTSEKVDLMDEIRNISQRGYTVFMIEHDMRFVMGLCERIAVLNFGRIIAEGGPDAIRNDPQVIEAYLGRDDDDEQEAAR